MARGAAKESKLGALHEMTATILTEQLQWYRSQDPPEHVPAALLAQVLKFLKDNNISADADSPEMKRLQESFGSNVLGFPFQPKQAEMQG